MTQTMQKLALLGLLALSACTPQACDPSQAGFLSGIGCEASGSYGVRNQAQQSALAQQNAALLQNRAAASNEGARASQALISRDQARRRLSAVDSQTAQLRRRVQAAQARGNVDAGRLAAAQSELDSLQQERSAAGQAPTDDQVRALEAHRRRLQDQLQGI